ncbi:MAG: cysteine--tRNA ligase [Cardiobacteriaceae bacterium]|nr:cysteine--tRNA ligase [Cardiobacteriaceae bacterium]
MLHLYNSLSGKKEEFQAINPPEVGMYVCGMTVYDYCHIGHARVMVVFDILARHLRNLGYKLKYVRNITDIDDKIIKRAAESNIDVKQLTEKFIQEMKADEHSLLCTPPNFEPRATEYIPEIIKIIEKLLQLGYAYRANNGDVYYHVNKFQDYGKLAHRKLEDLQVGARIALNEEKENPLDFVLWKAKKANEPFWQSPFGDGRPGWHIECSAMSGKELGAHFDIHGGGNDLKFPHHECEIAQSEAFFGKKTVNFWLHNGFVQINDEKMSKSLGNFFTVREVLEKFDGETLRFFILQTHYRAPLNYSEEGLQEAKKALTRLYSAISQLNDDAVTVTDTESYKKYEEKFLEALNDDLNTPKALAVLFEIAKEANKNNDKTSSEFAAILKTLGAKIGILQGNAETWLKGESKNNSITEDEINQLISERLAAKKEKNFTRADEIRNQLKEQGVEIKDTAAGTEWKWL